MQCVRRIQIDDPGAASFPVAIRGNTYLAHVASARDDRSCIGVERQVFLQPAVGFVVHQLKNLPSEDRRFDEDHPVISYVIGVVEL